MMHSGRCECDLKAGLSVCLYFVLAVYISHYKVTNDRLNYNDVRFA